MKYLYGASVQGIQKFIFETNKLKDIIGASSLVEQICTTLFDQFATNGESVVRAAGNIKYIFNNKEDCRRAVKNFPRKVMTCAPGITISQAVIELKDSIDFLSAVDLLESRLRAARNRPIVPVELGLMGIIRSRTTGKPAVTKIGAEYFDASTKSKRSDKNITRKLCIKAFGDNTILDTNLPYNISDISENNSWIAIIHADGNGLGQIIQRIGADKEVFTVFSQALDTATTLAAQDAYIECIAPTFAGEIIPMRPIVLGGDDFTFIIRGDLAVRFTDIFLRSFENRTQQLFQKEIIVPFNSKLSAEQKKILEEGLTACAGIAFIKESYPFYYGYRLAEDLCSESKRNSKRINEKKAPSCLMFHKVQDSFIESYENIKKRELSPDPKVSYVYGPYYIKDCYGKCTPESLLKRVNALNGEEGNALKTSLRNWMSILAIYGFEAAKQCANRITEIFPDKKLDDFLQCTNGLNPVYDILSLHSIINSKTK